MFGDLKPTEAIFVDHNSDLNIQIPGKALSFGLGLGFLKFEISVSDFICIGFEVEEVVEPLCDFLPIMLVERNKM